MDKVQLYSSPLKTHPFKRLKFGVEESSQGFPMSGVRFAETVADGLPELVVPVIVGVVRNFLFDKLPQPLNQVRIRRVGRQIHKLDIQLLGSLPDQRALLVSGIVQDEH